MENLKKPQMPLSKWPKNGILFSLLCIILFNAISRAQPVLPNYSGTPLLSFNTGVNIQPSGILQVPIGNSDPNWKVATTQAIGGSAVVITPPTASTFNCLSWSPNQTSGTMAQWITMPGLNCSGIPGNVSCSSVQDLYFTKSFSFPANPITQVSGQIFASDFVQDIWLQNSTNSGVPFIIWNSNVGPSGPYPSNRQTPVQFSWCNFVQGNNTIYVHVKRNPTFTNASCQALGMKITDSWGVVTYSAITGPSIACAASTNTYVFTPTLSAPASVTYSWTNIPTWSAGSLTGRTITPVAGTAGGVLTAVFSSVTPNGKSCLATGGYSVTVPPQLTITPSATVVCIGDCITLTGSGAQNYTWTAGTNIPIGTGPIITVCPSVNTTYKLTGKTSAGCTYTKTVYIPVSQKPIVMLNSTGSVICQGQMVGMWPGGNAATYKWQPGNVTAFLNTPINFSPNVTTLYSLIGTSATGCTTTKTINIQVNPKPSLTVTASPSLMCSGSTSNLNASGATSYTWLPGGSNASGIVVSPTATTVYTVIGSFSTGCTASKTVTVLVNPTPTVTVNPPALCPGITNTLTATGALPSSYVWTIFGSPNTVITATPSITLNATSCTSIQVCGKAANGCVKCTTFVLCPGVPMDLIISNPVLCASSASCTNVSVTSTVTTFTSTWSLGGSNIGNSPTITVCPTITTVYNVSATPTGTFGCPTTSLVSVTVQTNCCTNPTASATTSLVTIAGLGGNFTNNSYLLNSSMTLTANTTFQNAEVWITPGVQITVPSGTILTLDHAHLFGCSNTMWQGIKILDGGSVRTPSSSVNPANSMIEDAFIGLELDNIQTQPSAAYMPILIEGIVFNKNRIGIRISNSNPLISGFSLGINGCVFSSRNLQYTTFPATPTWSSSSMTGGGIKVASNPVTGLFPPYTFPNGQQAVLKAPYANQPGHIGIQIENIGDPNDATSSAGQVVLSVSPPASISGDFNLFDGLGTGIEITDASFYSRNMVFQNMQMYNTSNGLYGGNGIDQKTTGLRNAGLQILPAFGGFGARFWDCIKGINANNVYNLYITGSSFRSSQSVTNWMVNGIPGQYGIYSNTNRFYHYVHGSEFNNLRFGFSLNTPQTTQPYDMTGNTLGYGIYADLLYVDQNYFGPEVLSSTPYSGGTPNTSEFMDEAIQVLTPNTGGWVNSAQNPGIKNANILYNRMDRVYRGVHIETMEDCPLAVEGNSLYIEDDYTFGSPGNPQFGYGIGLFNSTDNKTISTNTLEAIGSAPPNNVSLVYCERNQGNGSPNVHCNFTTNSHFGFQFEDQNPNTIWSANHMCNEYAGLALTNSAVIGQQGTASIGSDNFWEFGAPNCNPWTGSGFASFETFIENSNALLSPLFVVPLAGFSPAMNVANNGLDYNQAGAINSPNGIVHLQANLDCAQNNTAYVPSWRLQNTNGLTTKDSKSLFEDDAIQMYPNPTNGGLTVFYADATGTCTIRVIDLRGQVVYSDLFKGGAEYQVDLSTVPASVYIVELQKENKIIRKKLIKTN